MQTKLPSRRRFIKNAGKIMLLAGGSRSITGMAGDHFHGDWNHQRSHPIFRHGVASGDPLTDRIIIWTRVSMEDYDFVDVGWQMAEDPDFLRIVSSGYVTTDASKDFTVKVDVDGLDSDKTYFYRFHVDEYWSMIGRTKTSPLFSSQIRLGVVSCSSIWSGYMNAYDRLAERNDLDLIIHCGDYIYDWPDEDELRLISPNPIDQKKPASLAEMRRRYAFYRQDPLLQRAHQQHPFSIIWDNHDLGIDGDIRLAIQAYHEWTPTRSPRAEDPRFIYRKLEFGNLADIFLLDTRYIGRNQSISGSQDLSILGDEQFQWLCDGLRHSTAVWKIIGNQVIMSSFEVFGNPLSKAHWGGYPKDRKRFYEFLSREGIQNTVVVTGDAHMSIASELMFEKKSVGVEFLPTSVSRGNLDEEIKKGFRKIAAGAVETLLPVLNPGMRYIETREHGYGIVDLTEDGATFEFWYTPIDNFNTSQKLGKAFHCTTMSHSLRNIKRPQPTRGMQRLPAPLFPADVRAKHPQLN